MVLSSISVASFARNTSLWPTVPPTGTVTGNIAVTRKSVPNAPCTRSKNCVKTVLRHVWKDYEDLADDARYTPEYKDFYSKRKQTIERGFADGKEKHGMRYTRYRGLAQVSKLVRLKFTAMNPKGLARWKAKRQSRLSFLLFSACTYLLCFAACLAFPR